MSNNAIKTKKQIGDRVVITGGPRKGIQGNIIALQGVKATLKLDDGCEITAMLAWLDKVDTPQAAPENVETVTEPEGSPVVETTLEATTEPPTPPVETVSEPVIEPAPIVTEIAPVVKKRGRKPRAEAVTADSTPVQAEPIETTEVAPTAETSTVATESAPVAPKRTRKTKSNPAPETAPESNVAQNPYEQMTVVELQKLAKERVISIARTKADFCRIIKELEPDCDTEALKGQALYNKVAALHISRLRSKKDLVVILTNS